MNNRQLTTTNRNALFFEMIPAGISRIAVRGFRASHRTSSHRLNAIAALRAKTMHNTTRTNRIRKYSHGALIRPHLGVTMKCHPGTTENAMPDIPKKNPMIANGIAKIVCENRIKLK